MGPRKDLNLKKTGRRLAEEVNWHVVHAALRRYFQIQTLDLTVGEIRALDMEVQRVLDALAGPSGLSMSNSYPGSSFLM